jgi:hypothetical protein
MKKVREARGVAAALSGTSGEEPRVSGGGGAPAQLINSPREV